MKSIVSATSDAEPKSLPARGAWIEIGGLKGAINMDITVAPRKGSVD